MHASLSISTPSSIPTTTATTPRRRHVTSSAAGAIDHTAGSSPAPSHASVGAAGGSAIANWAQLSLPPPFFAMSLARLELSRCALTDEAPPEPWHRVDCVASDSACTCRMLSHLWHMDGGRYRRRRCSRSCCAPARCAR